VTRAIVFDCFGVLYADNWIKFLDRYAGTDALRRELSDLTSASDRGLIDDAAYYQALSEVSGLAPAAIRADLHDTSAFHPDVADLIRELKPRYQTALLSNSERSFLEEFLAANGARDLFDVILASSETPFIKPQKGIFIELAHRLGLPFEDLLFVDDTPMHVDAANSYGLPAIRYEHLRQLRSELKQQGILAV
jgi:HAD superfamily hydrolase (TIGR01509 family)